MIFIIYLIIYLLIKKIYNVAINLLIYLFINFQFGEMQHILIRHILSKNLVKYHSQI